MQNDLREITRMTDFVGNFGEKHQLSKEVIFAFTLSIEELITNTIHYGCTDGIPHQLILDLSVDRTRCKAILSDDAVPFNPLARVEVDTSLPLEEKPIGGLGIHMVKKLMTQVEYEFRDGHNILTFQRKLDEG